MKDDSWVARLETPCIAYKKVFFPSWYLKLSSCSPTVTAPLALCTTHSTGHSLQLPTWGQHTQSFGHSPPRSTQWHIILDVLVLPILGLAVQEVEGVHVPHAVGNQHNRAPILLIQQLDHLAKRHKIVFILIWNTHIAQWELLMVTAEL